ncbi:MAG TPA: hypothetical protein VN903_10025 [Polyangia bacterium]|jgi:TPR repeat protein|nr:hypothetical protein [Polyangia bacterium]
MSGAELWALATREIRRPGWSGRRYAALVTRAARAGSAEAEQALATMRLDGYRDGQGRVLVRANPKAAARAFARAASAGDVAAAFDIGYCLDVGRGVARDGRLAMKWYRRAWRVGNPSAAANIATMYRDRRQLKTAVSWWKRAVAAGGFDEAVDVGYSYQYGIGVRRDVASAIRWYRRALRATYVAEATQEEALYHLAVIDLDRQPARRAHAVALLNRAAKDQDYPEAMALLAQLRDGRRPVPCRCRRDLRKSLPGHARCRRHPRR